MKRMRGLVVSVVMLSLAACGGSDGGTTVGATTTPAENGTTVPPAAGGNGVAHVEFDGEPAYDAPLAGLSYEHDFPPGPVELYWATSDGSGDLTLRFPTYTGTKSTSVSPKIELVIVADPGLFLASNGGECEITVETADPTAVAGSFDCTFSSEPERVTGTFEANAG